MDYVEEYLEEKSEMNQWQALAVRRKKILLAYMFDFSELSQQEYMESELLTADMIPEILVSVIIAIRLWKFII